MNTFKWLDMNAAREFLQTADSRNRVRTGIGGLLIVFGTLISWHKAVIGGDDFHHFYVLANAIADGRDLYSVPTVALGGIYKEYLGFDYPAHWAVFSPPSIAFALGPLVLVPFAIAELLWFWIMWIVLLTGVFRLTVYFAPAMPTSMRLVIVGLVLITSAVRWGFFQLQAAPLILGLFGYFLAPGARCASWLPAALTAWVTCLKVTMGVPFVALAILQRRYGTAVCAAAAFLLTNIMGFARIGGWDSVLAYRQNIAVLEIHGNDPNPWNPASVSRIDWQYMLNTLYPDRTLAMVLSIVLTLAGCGLIVWSARQRRPSREDVTGTVLFSAPVVSLSMLAVYHHHYDSAVLLAPVVGYLIGPRVLIRMPGSMWFVLFVMLYAGVFPYAYAHNVAYGVAGDIGLVAAKASGSFLTAFAFVASAVALWHYAREGVAKQEHG